MKTCLRGFARSNAWRRWIVTFAAIVALLQSAVGGNDQESPPTAPAVNSQRVHLGSFLFEDQWPVQGDFDFNDIVPRYSDKPFFTMLDAVNKLQPLFGVPRVNEATGELFVEYLDLVISGRGLDLVWGRTYRSKIGLDTAMGVNWDFSYNIRAALSGPNVTVQDGQNRIDTYFLQSDGSYSTDELFRRGTLSEKVFTLEFADKTRWIFKSLNGSPTSGKIDKIIDRNSNQIQFQYDGAGRLFLIIDSLNRPFQISYDGANRIQAVQDFAGRTIQYQHLTSPTPGIGDVGDLVLVRSQAVTGTPIGNDFPSGKTAQFTYSTGLGGGRDHNLLTAKDGNNVPWFQAVYTTTAAATSFLYDRVASEIVGTANETKIFTYLARTSPTSRFNAATKTIVNDAIGNVHESLFDSKNRLIDLRRFTGRSTPGVPVTESSNRPMNPVRPTDPAFFETTIEWNRDSLPSRVTFPRGNGVEMVYQRDLDPNTNPRERGNLRTHRQLPVSGAPLVQHFEYASGFGTGERTPLAPQFNFGFEKTFFNGNGDPGPYIQAVNACNMVDYIDEDVSSSHYCVQYRESDFDFSSRLQCRVEDYLKLGDGIKCKAGPIYGDLNGDGIDYTGIYYHVGFGDGSGAAHKIRMEEDEAPYDHIPELASLGEVGGGIFETGDPLVGWCVARTDARGFTWTCARDANGNAMSVTRPDGVTTDIEHNANGQLTAIVWPQNNTGHRERDEWHYYTSGAQNGYLQSFIRDAGGLNLTTAFTHNSVGCVTQIVDPRGNDTQFFVNQLNQVVQVTSRDAGTPGRFLTNIYRDANNRITRVDVQNKDEFGGIGTPAFFVTSFSFDSLDHVTSITRDLDNAHTITAQYFYDPIRELIEMRSPLAAGGLQPDARVRYAFDERNLPFTAIRAPSSPIATGSKFTYDLNGNLARLETGAPAGLQHTTLYDYDGFDRLTMLTDPVGTNTQYGYNENHQVTNFTMQGTFLDAKGNPNFGPLRGGTFVYDTNGILTQRTESWFDPITTATIDDGARTISIGRDPALNVTSVTDDNGHATSFSYDGANRLSRITDPKANSVDYTYDSNGNLVTRTRTDKSDSASSDQVFVLTNVYDGLDRLITSTDNVGNAQSYLYNSRSNRVRYIDPRNKLVQSEYDGLNRLLRSGRDMNGNGSGFDAGIDVISGRIWDDNSRLTGATNPNSYSTQYQYDALGRCLQRTNADTTAKTWSYDAWGNAVQSHDENATVCINNYDNLNRLRQRQIIPGPGVSNATTFEIYDYPGEYRWPERAINNAAVVRYTFDSLAHRTSESLGNLVTSYTHDAVGNLLTLQSPSGRTLTYAHDVANLCTSVSLTATSDGDTLGTMATYNYIGRRTESVSHRNATSTLFSYNGFVDAPPSSDLGWGQVAGTVTLQLGNIVLDQRTFTYDANQNLSERADTRSGGPQLLHHYDYDPANRNVHTQVNAPGPTLVRDTIYNYDRNGNRLAVNGFQTPDPGPYFLDNTTPEPADAQMSQYTSTPRGNYLYDANGNRTSLNGGGANKNYTYDYANRLVDFTDVNTGLRIANYQYDAHGRRIAKTLDPDGKPNTTNFFYTGRTVLEERDGSGGVTAGYSTVPVRGGDWNGGGGSLPWWVLCTMVDLPHLPIQPLPPIGVCTERGGEMCDDQCSCQRDYCVQYRESDWAFNLRTMDDGRGPWPELLDPRYSLAPVEMRRAGNNFTYVGAGSDVAIWPLTNPAGGAAERYEYEDFGDPHFFDGSGNPLPASAIGNPYLFNGMRFDGESGLYCTVSKAIDYSSPDLFLMNFDPKIGASLQRESTHVTNCCTDGHDWEHEY